MGHQTNMCESKHLPHHFFEGPIKPWGLAVLLEGWFSTSLSFSHEAENKGVMRSLGVGKFGTVKVGSFSTHRSIGDESFGDAPNEQLKKTWLVGSFLISEVHLSISGNHN